MARPKPEDYRLTAEEYGLLIELLKNEVLMGGIRKINRYVADIEMENMRIAALSLAPNVHMIGNYAARADAISKWENGTLNALDHLAPEIRKEV